MMADQVLKKKLPRKQKQRVQTIEGNLTPGKKWCRMFVSVYEGRDLDGVTQENVDVVKAWMTRGDEIRRKTIRDHTIMVLMLTPEDSAMRAKAHALFMAFPRKKLKDLRTSLGIVDQSDASGDEKEPKEKPKKQKKMSIESGKRTPVFEPSYHAAGIFCFAVRPKKEKSEVVVLMLAEDRKKNRLVLNFPGGKQDFKTDLGDPVATAVREFTEETAHIFENDKKNLAHRLRDQSNAVGLTRCLLEQGSYFLLFGQVPYMADANEKFQAAKENYKMDDSATQHLLWVPLKTLRKSLKAGKLEKFNVELAPGDKSTRAEYTPHTLVEQLLREEKISERLNTLKSLADEGKLVSIELGESKKKSRKRKRSDSDDDDDDEDIEDSAQRRSFGDNEDDFGDKTMRRIDLTHADWEGLIATNLQELQDESGEADASAVRKAVVKRLAGDIRNRLSTIIDARLKTQPAFQVFDGLVSRSASKRRKLKGGQIHEGGSL